MNKLIRRFKQISILILAITLFGCEDNERVLPEVVAGFTYTINADTGVVTFINTSENATHYSWDFGDETNATLANPVKVYTSGTYTIVLKASNIAGASATFEDTITINVPLPMTLPITFDDTNVKYEAVTFEGATFQVVDNPAPGGTNDKASMVGAITNSGKINEGISFNLGTEIDFTINKTITMNFWADAPVSVVTKLEKGASNEEVSASHGGTGWETLSFDFNSTSKYSRLTLYVDKSGTEAGTFYVDDIAQIKSAPVITLNGNTTMNIILGTTFTDPGAAAIDGYGEDISGSIVVAGDVVDVNTLGTYIITYNVSDSEEIAANEVTRTVIVELDAIAPVITLIGGATVNVVIGNTFTDPGATALDNVDGDLTSSIVVAGDAVDVNASGTYIITYNVSDAAGNAANQVTRTVIVGLDTIAPVITLIGNATVNVTVGDTFTDPGATALDNIEGDLTSSIVVGGDTVDVNTAATYIITYDVSDAAGNAAIQVTRTVVVANAISDGNFATNGDFETGDDTGWAVFPNRGIAQLDNTISNGGSWSGKLETSGPSNPAFKQEKISQGTVKAGDTVSITFDHIGANDGEGGVFNVLFFVEGAGGSVPITHIFSPAPILSANWSTFNGTFTIPLGIDTSGGISVLIETVCGGAPVCSVSANIDNLSITLNP